VKAWDVDMSRRQKELTHSRMPANVFDLPAKKDEGMAANYFESIEPTQEIVILNTEKGFIPETVRLKKGQNYKIHVVNVNNKEKNTSFVLDAFSEHHGTYFGQEKSFSLSPRTEGIFSFQCPETAKQGRLIIVSDSERKPANAN
jgi:plastocyanin domain-containing protein